MYIREFVARLYVKYINFTEYRKIIKTWKIETFILRHKYLKDNQFLNL